MSESESGRKENVDKYQLLTSTQNTILGICAGTIEVTILQPMLYCKNAVQQNLGLTLNPKVLYRGLLMSIVNMSVLTGLQFPLTGMVTRTINGGSGRELGDGEKIIAGFTGGAISGIACAPMELVMIQQQRFAGTIINTPGRLVSNFGSASLFRGLISSCGREGMFTAGYMGIGPVPATQKVLKKHGWDVNDLDLIELNEAFASQSLAVIRNLGLSEERVNVNGGAIALGHPLGCSGARILTTLIYALRAKGGGKGLASLCVGVGQGVSTLIEVPS